MVCECPLAWMAEFENNRMMYISKSCLSSNAFSTTPYSKLGWNWANRITYSNCIIITYRYKPSSVYLLGTLWLNLAQAILFSLLQILNRTLQSLIKSVRKKKLNVPLLINQTIAILTYLHKSYVIGHIFKWEKIFLLKHT